MRDNTYTHKYTHIYTYLYLYIYTFTYTFVYTHERLTAWPSGVPAGSAAPPGSRGI